MALAVAEELERLEHNVVEPHGSIEYRVHFADGTPKWLGLDDSEVPAEEPDLVDRIASWGMRCSARCRERPATRTGRESPTGQGGLTRGAALYGPVKD